MDAAQTSIYYAVIIASVLIGVILGFFIVVLIRNHRKNQALYRSKILAEITTLENERKRIAADLHDEMGPSLVGIKMKLDSINVNDPDDQATLDKAKENLNGMMQKMKEVSNDLLPAVLIKKGLAEAVQFFIEDVSRHSSLQIQFNPGKMPAMNEQVTINIYRIIQELVHNTVKHAGAGTLSINFTTDNHLLTINTKDDGKGFDYEEAMKTHLGLGLRNLLSRVELLGGKMFIESSKTKGTEYSFEIPI